MATEEFQVYEKGVNDYVTNVDRTLDQLLTERLTQLFPGDGLISEENADSWETIHLRDRRLWLIDPLDGTDDFIHRKPHYSVMVGAMADYQPCAGWVYAPEFDQMYFGGEDVGLFQIDSNRAPTPLIPKTPALPAPDFCPILIGYKDQKRYGEAIVKQVPAAKFDSIGSFGLKVLQVIQGHAGLYLYLNGRVKLWDTVGPVALAQAAGLVCCDLAGNALRFSPDAIDIPTLAHQQPIIIGWPAYVNELRSRLETAVALA